MKVLGLQDQNYERVVFHEITKKAVTEAFQHTRKIDQDLVNSQETRRILDRIIGFRLSKLIQSKTDGTSAGRVQSVAVKLIVDKEREIQAFKPVEYWTIEADFKDFKASLFQYQNKKLEIATEVEANQILNVLSNAFQITSVDKKSGEKKSKPPFTTSTLQQMAYNKLGMNTKKTMSIAQKLYEGIELSDETVGLITYMRTDSIRLSDEFIKDTYGYITGHYGQEYVGYVKTGKSKENVQDAHEAIRPTSITRDPLSVKPFLSNDEYKLYRMIYYRALASLMSSAKVENTTVILDNHDYQFKATGQIITFDGYLKIYSDYETTTEAILPPFDTYRSNVIVSDKIEKEQHFTKPPARYSEASLVETMEKLGIGRPSTYSTIIERIKSRGYVNVVEKRFIPTDIGFEITDKLQEYFHHIINVEYTANMETDLDNIAEGKAVWYTVLQSFYDDFEPSVQKAFDSMPKKEVEQTGEMCPECGNPLVIRKGRYGEFVACSNYPKCKYIKAEAREEKVILDCPNCDGKIVEKHSRKGKVFYGCNHYPDCKTAYWDKPIDQKCEKCGSILLETTKKKKSIKCSNPECDFQKDVSS